MEQLSTHYTAAEGITAPGYKPEDHGAGIVHFGVGAFHRSHQAVYTDSVLALHGGDWRIIGVSLQSTGIADAINHQSGLYSLLTRSSEDGAISVRIVASIERVEAAARATSGIFAALADEKTKIVTMTVTEKAYGIDRILAQVDPDNPVIEHDLKHTDAPKGLVGIIVKGLSLRKEKGLPAFTVLCCDNLPDNGKLIRNGVLDYARRTDPALAEWISENGAFPCSMVDRITPATTTELESEVAARLTVSDKACVEAEEYSQWVIEDDFACGRPRWEDAGVVFVDDVAPYEKMKLRMLNGAHSLIAYLGFLSGHRYVRDAMASKPIKTLVSSHVSAAAHTLPNLKDFDLAVYGEDLVQRFSNVNIAHETYQIAMDGSQKMPQRIFAPALESLQRNLPIDTFALATAAWIRYTSGLTADGSQYDIRDPLYAELNAAFLSKPNCAETICKNVFRIPGIVPQELADNNVWLNSTITYLELFLPNKIDSVLSLYQSRVDH